MPLIGVRKLHQRTSEVLRQVCYAIREENTEYVITYQGRPIALLLPVVTEELEATMVQTGKQAVAGGWETYARVAETLRQAWPAEQQTETLLEAIRRE